MGFPPPSRPRPRNLNRKWRSQLIFLSPFLCQQSFIVPIPDESGVSPVPRQPPHSKTLARSAARHEFPRGLGVRWVRGEGTHRFGEWGNDATIEHNLEEHPTSTSIPGRKRFQLCSPPATELQDGLKQGRKQKFGKHPAQRDRWARCVLVDFCFLLSPFLLFPNETTDSE